jgi:tetratricopeptide (TPR) repeat protein/2-polyprenyl-3-methyl-5-hydroxy-6-metoxy-1,4-benzoquinol methylase
MAGELPEAEKICLKVMKENAEHLPSILVMALIYFRAGKRNEAAGIINSVIKSAPECAESLWLRGNMHSATRNMLAAIADAEAAIKIKPWFFDAHLLRVNMLYMLSKPNDALACLEKTQDFATGTRDSEAIKAACYSSIGMHGVAEDIIRKLLVKRPADNVLRNALGLACFNQGKYDDAIEEHKKTVAADPHNHDNLMMLAADQIAARYYDAALDSLKRAEAINPGIANLHSLKSTVYLIKGDSDAALKSSWMAVRLGQNDKTIWQRFSKVLQQVSFTAANPAIEADLIKCMSFVETDKTLMVSTILSYLTHVEAINQVVQIVMSGDYEEFSRRLQNGELLGALAHPLLLLLLENTIAPNTGIEMLMTLTRRTLLQLIAAGNIIKHERLPEFMHALAKQCYLGEYVYAATEEEAIMVADLRAQIAAMVNAGKDIPEEKILILLCYASMSEMKELADLWQKPASQAMAALAMLEWQEPQEEKAILPEIKSITAISDEISRQVQDQYEQNPYPRWVELPRTVPYDVKASMIEMFPQLNNVEDKWSFPRNPEMLVAGCGTGRHPIATARQYNFANILAVDLSRSSLAYAMRKAKHYDVPNLEFAQADILAMPQLGRKFDIIESIGVIHHMRDPMQGWSALYDMLNSGGILRLGLYSEIARRSIIACRNFIAERGYKSTDDDIKRCRQEIIRHPIDSLEYGVTRSRDFYSTSNCRDLIFHVQEHRFTIPMIKAAIDKFDLEFLGFCFEDSYFVQRHYMPMFPDDVYATALDNWHKFEEARPNSFAGMYNFCMRKK